MNRRRLAPIATSPAATLILLSPKVAASLKKNSAVTADRVATKLHALPAAADIRPPYILVGHSLGGLYVQMFARKYPREVSGVVLLDSSSPDAPSELKTRARLEPGTAAISRKKAFPKAMGRS